MADLIESSLLVVADFRDSAGTAWRTGDRAPLACRAIREAARAHPDWFLVEFSTEPFDAQADWFREVEDRFQAQYEEAKRYRDGAEERRQRALREELRTQDAAQPGPERRFKAQEKERAEREKRRREELERRQIESELELASRFLTRGFNVQR
jgi:hypothetical protein